LNFFSQDDDSVDEDHIHEHDDEVHEYDEYTDQEKCEC
jgi:hypothetical protein